MAANRKKLPEEMSATRAAAVWGVSRQRVHAWIAAARIVAPPAGPRMARGGRAETAAARKSGAPLAGEKRLNSGESSYFPSENAAVERWERAFVLLSEYR